MEISAFAAGLAKLAAIFSSMVTTMFLIVISCIALLAVLAYLIVFVVATWEFAKHLFGVSDPAKTKQTTEELAD